MRVSGRGAVVDASPLAAGDGPSRFRGRQAPREAALAAQDARPRLERTTPARLAADVVALADARPPDRPRLLLGLTGPPGTGKSTVARAVVDALPAGSAAVVPMDGFHLASDLLAGTGLAERRGAVDTFDSGGFASLVERLRSAREPVVYAPTFERALGDPVAASLAVPRACRIVLVEGNYLLVDGPDWRRVRACLDAVWYLHSDDGVRFDRLVARHVRAGRSPVAARAFVDRSDRANAAVVAATAADADRLLDVSLPPSHGAPSGRPPASTRSPRTYRSVPDGPV